MDPKRQLGRLEQVGRRGQGRQRAPDVRWRGRALVDGLELDKTRRRTLLVGRPPDAAKLRVGVRLGVREARDGRRHQGGVELLPGPSSGAPAAVAGRVRRLGDVVDRVGLSGVWLLVGRLLLLLLSALLLVRVLLLEPTLLSLLLLLIELRLRRVVEVLLEVRLARRRRGAVGVCGRVDGRIDRTSYTLGSHGVGEMEEEGDVVGRVLRLSPSPSGRPAQKVLLPTSTSGVVLFNDGTQPSHLLRPHARRQAPRKVRLSVALNSWVLEELTSASCLLLLLAFPPSTRAGSSSSSLQTRPQGRQRSRSPLAMVLHWNTGD